jgi:hypothetical protein
MMRKPGTLAATVLLTLVALAHLLRLVLGTPITVNGFPLPVGASAVAFVVVGAIVLLLWRERFK